MSYYACWLDIICFAVNTKKANINLDLEKMSKKILKIILAFVRIIC